ncbi:MAG: hypothetical protein DMG42_34460, partial [Acidobacteria bacterium]
MQLGIQVADGQFVVFCFCGSDEAFDSAARSAASEWIIAGLLADSGSFLWSRGKLCIEFRRKKHSQEQHTLQLTPMHRSCLPDSDAGQLIIC